MHDAACKEVIRSGNEIEVIGYASYNLYKKLANIRMLLILWNNNHFGILDLELKERTEEIHEH